MKIIFKKGILICLILILFFSFVNPALAIGNQELNNFIEIKDYRGQKIKLQKPVKKIVCLSASLSEILVALGARDKIIAWDRKSGANKLLQQKNKKILVVAENSHSLQLEAILELQPDLVIGDTMLQQDDIKKMNSFSIPVIVERASESKRVKKIINNFALIVDSPERAKRLNNFNLKFKNLIKKRLKAKQPEKVKVYWEWNKPYKTGSATSTAQLKIAENGGLNICAELKGSYPQVAREFILKQDPEIILKQAARNSSQAEMKALYTKIKNRNIINLTKAAQNDRILIISWDIFSGLFSVIGDLHLAKFFYPELFKDLKPDEIYTKLLSEFLEVNKVEPVIYKK